MRDVRCIFGKHTFGESIRTGIVYEFRCQRCGEEVSDDEKTFALLDTLFVKEPATLADGTPTVKISVRKDK